MSKKKVKVEPAAVEAPLTVADIENAIAVANTPPFPPGNPAIEIVQDAVESAIRKEVAPVVEVISTMRRALALMARARRRRRSA